MNQEVIQRKKEMYIYLYILGILQYPFKNMKRAFLSIKNISIDGKEIICKRKLVFDALLYFNHQSIGILWPLKCCCTRNYLLPIVSIIKIRRLEWLVHIIGLKNRKAFKEFFFRKLDGKRRVRKIKTTMNE